MKWVTRGHARSTSSFANNFRLERDKEVGMVSLCLSHQYASTDMQHDLFGSKRDLDLRSNIDLDLSRSCYTCFDAYCEANTMVSTSLLYHFKHGSYHRKTVSLKNAVFDLSWPLTPKPLVLGEIWRHLGERAFQELSIAFLNFDVAVTGTEIMRIIWSHVM